MLLRRLAPAVFLALALTARAEDPATFEVGSLTFTRPADWKWIPVTSPMRKAQLQIPGADASKAADVTFFYFGESNGGGTDANVQRWFKQFSGAAGAEKTEVQDINGTKVNVVTTEGTFASGMPGGPSTPLENYALLGAIIENAQGFVFVKATGPKETVKGAQPKFLEFIKTALPAKK